MKGEGGGTESCSSSIRKEKERGVERKEKMEKTEKRKGVKGRKGMAVEE